MDELVYQAQELEKLIEELESINGDMSLICVEYRDIVRLTEELKEVVKERIEKEG